MFVRSIVFTFLLVLAGGANAGKKDALTALGSVSFEVQPARQATLMTRGKASAAMAGGLGVLIAAQMAKKPNELSALIEKAGIHPETIAAEALRDQLTQRGILQVLDQDADAVIRLESFPSGGHAGDGMYRIGMQIGISIVGRDGKVIWNRQEGGMDTSLPAAEFEVLFNDPQMVTERLRAAAAEAAKILASRIYVARM